MPTTLNTRAAPSLADLRPRVDGFQHRIEAMVNALEHRVDSNVVLTRGGERFAGSTLLELARDFVDLDTSGRHPQGARGMAPLELVDAALQYRSAGYGTTSDFVQVLSTFAARRLRVAYDQEPPSYRLWARKGPNLVNFKPISAVQLGSAPDLLKIGEHGEFKVGTVGDAGETYSLATYGRIAGLSRQAVINDDLRAFDRIITSFGAAAARLENRLVYGQLMNNAALSDGNSLFSAAHGNAATGLSSALQFAALATMRAAMRAQKGLSGETLNLTPRFLLVPAALETVASQLTSTAYAPALAGATTTSPGSNDFAPRGRSAMQVVVEPLLDLVAPATWYATADSDRIDTVEFAYLEGAEGPQIEQRNGFEVDGVEVKCKLDFGCKAVDFRGLYRGAGF